LTGARPRRRQQHQRRKKERKREGYGGTNPEGETGSRRRDCDQRDWIKRSTEDCSIRLKEGEANKKTKTKFKTRKEKSKPLETNVWRYSARKLKLHTYVSRKDGAALWGRPRNKREEGTFKTSGKVAFQTGTSKGGTPSTIGHQMVEDPFLGGGGGYLKKDHCRPIYD